MEFDASMLVALVLTALAVVGIVLLRRHGSSGDDKSSSRHDR